MVRFLVNTIKRIIKGLTGMDLGTTGDNKLTNDFSTIPDVSVSAESDRIQPRQVTTGTTRGTHITEGADGLPQVLVGSQQTFGNGLFVAKPGVSVIESTDPNDLIFNSNQNIFKIVKKITTQIPQYVTTYSGSTTAGASLLTYPHGLNYVPIVDVYVKAQIVNINTYSTLAVSYVALPINPGNAQDLNAYCFPNPSNSSSYFGTSIIYGVDDTNVYVQAHTLLNGDSHDTIAAIPVTIFLRQETATA